MTKATKSPTDDLIVDGASSLATEHAIASTNGSGVDRKPPPGPVVLRVVSGTTGGACTLSLVQSGAAISLKLNDKVAGLVGARVVPVWQRSDDGMVKLKLVPPEAGERGFGITTNRRLRPHAEFPRAGVVLSSWPLVLDDPVVVDGIIEFTIKGDGVTIPQAA
jgi:hypothetical protein